MATHIQKFWSLIAAIICYGLAMTVLVFGGPEGTEDVPRWAFSLVTLTFTAILSVGLQSCLNARSNGGKGDEEPRRD